MVAEQDASGWYPAVSTSGSFITKLPCPFNDYTLQLQDPKVGLLVTYCIGAISADGCGFGVMETLNSEKMELKDFDALVNGFKENTSLKVTNVNKSTYIGHPTLSFEIVGPNSGTFLRYIKGPVSHFTIVLKYPNGFRDRAAKVKTRFFDSFKLKSSKKQTKE